ncbi:MAG: hypothetical protein QM639_07575 [Rhodocyclaceae bacterium]
MKTILLTALAAFLTGCQTLAAPSAFETFSGQAYRGRIESAGELVSTHTYFTSDNGTITGRYEAYEEEAEAPTLGTLSACREHSPRLLQCRWEDKYGHGLAGFFFSPDHSSFFGAWSADHTTRANSEVFMWYGEASDDMRADAPLTCD